MNEANTRVEIIDLACQVVSAYVSNNSVPPTELPGLISTIHGALATASSGAAPAAPVALTPAVPIKKSVTAGFIICLEDGKKFKSLRRHLASTYNLTPEQYRAKWGLPADYPMTSPDYSAQRSALAKSIGLGAGRRARVAETAPAAEAVEAPKAKRAGKADAAKPDVAPQAEAQPSTEAPARRRGRAAKAVEAPKADTTVEVSAPTARRRAAAKRGPATASVSAPVAEAPKARRGRLARA